MKLFNMMNFMEKNIGKEYDMEHYYTADPSVKSAEREIEYEIVGNKFVFISDNGVFSKNHVDIATSFLIKTIYDEVQGDVLDVGCGYGVIGITMAKKAEVTSVTMLDVNHRALELSRRNSEKNKVVSKVQIIESDGFENITEKYDVIITNPPIRAGKSVIYKMYEDAKFSLKDGGALYLVINKKHGAPSTITFLNSLFGNCEVLDKKTGFNVIKCVKEKI